MLRARSRRGFWPEMRIVLFVAVVAPLLAENPDSEFFEKNVRPIFASKCQGCHGAKMQAAGLNLSSPAGLEKVVVKGDATQSRMYRALSYTGAIKMPPSGKLADAYISSIQKW